MNRNVYDLTTITSFTVPLYCYTGSSLRKQVKSTCHISIFVFSECIGFATLFRQARLPSALLFSFWFWLNLSIGCSITMTSCNGHDGVSNHQPHYCLLNSLFGRRSKKSSASLAFVRGIHRAPVNSPHKYSVTRKMFPFGDVIMSDIRHVSLVELLHTIQSKIWSTFDVPYQLGICRPRGIEKNEWIVCRVYRFVDFDGL